MAIVKEQTGMRLILADSQKKSVFTMSRVNPAMTPMNIIQFKEGFAGLSELDAELCFTEKAYELADDGN